MCAIIPLMEILKYPTDADLLERYTQIENDARAALLAGKVSGNAYLKQVFRGRPWSISTQGFVYGSSAGNFLEEASHQLGEADPGLAVTNPLDQHISFTEIAFHPISRKSAGLTPADILSYCHALMGNFIQDLEPVRLRLARLLPTLDPKDPDSSFRTGALVAAFLTDGDAAVFEVKKRIQEAVLQNGLPLGSIYGGPPKVLFVALGRFTEFPLVENGDARIMSVLDCLNKQLDSLTTPPVTNIKEVSVISTSPLDYKSPRGHINWLRLLFQQDGYKRGEFYPLRPSQRRERMLREI